MSHTDFIKKMDEMDNGERIKLFEYLAKNHFFMNELSEEEMQIIEDLRDGYVKVVEVNG